MSQRPALHLPSLVDLEQARRTIQRVAIRTPTLKIPQPLPGFTMREVYLKLENLQPIGSFKIRGAANAIEWRNPDDLRDGVCTASGVEVLTDGIPKSLADMESLAGSA